jgi:hypothetical protein
LARQKVNYHLRELERVGLVTLVEERKVRNTTERIVQATASAYLISPEALAELGTDPARVRDRFSWGYLVSVAGRVIRELAILRRRADAVGQKLATLTIDTEVRVSSSAALGKFATDLADAVARVVSEHHDEDDPEGRRFRLVAGVYPKVTKTEEEHEVEVGESRDAIQDFAAGFLGTDSDEALASEVYSRFQGVGSDDDENDDDENDDEGGGDG